MRCGRRFGEGQGQRQILPIRKDQEACRGEEAAEELHPRPCLSPRLAPGFLGLVADGVERESEQVERHQQGREVLLAVTIIVLEVITAGLEHVEGLVFDLPPATSAGGMVGDIGAVHATIGDKAVTVGDVAFGVADFDLEPVDLQRVPGIAQRNPGHPAEPVGEPLAAMHDLHDARGQPDTGDVFLDCLVG